MHKNINELFAQRKQEHAAEPWTFARAPVRHRKLWRIFHVKGSVKLWHTLFVSIRLRLFEEFRLFGTMGEKSQQLEN